MERPVGFPAISPLRSASRPHRRALELLLTLFRVVIYNCQRWVDGKMGIKIINTPAQPKSNFLFFSKKFVGSEIKMFWQTSLRVIIRHERGTFPLTWKQDEKHTKTLSFAVWLSAIGSIC
jgi:hypothetical protein